MAETTYRIFEEFDRRLGQTVFEVCQRPGGAEGWCLIAECNTRAEAREVVKRYREREEKKHGSADV